jgi:hypothetical protein
VDIGICMSASTLDEKLEARDEKNPEHAWNLARWPSGLSEKREHRLFVAVDGAWRGYFKLAKDALYNPEDERTPFTILFDTRTWTPIAPTPATRFRGFTYKVPAIATASAQANPPRRSQ